MKTSALKPGRGHGVTVQIEVTEATAAEHPNRYVTIPPNGRRCEFTGLGHAKPYQIPGPNGVAHAHLRVANLRTPGAARGQTLFHVGDRPRLLDGLAHESPNDSTN